MSGWFRSTPESEAALAGERLVLAATEAVHEAMDARNVNRKQLAGLLGVRPSEVSQRLSGRRNFTLRSFARMLHALGMRARLIIEPNTEPFTAGVIWKNQSATPDLGWHPWHQIKGDARFKQAHTHLIQFPGVVDIGGAYEHFPDQTGNEYAYVKFWDGHKVVDDKRELKDRGSEQSGIELACP